MFTSASISGFRCFTEESFSDLRRVTLLTGRNNTGKTALLEALFLLAGGYNAQLVMTITGMRGLSSFTIGGLPREAPWAGIFTGMDVQAPIRMQARLANGAEYSVTFRSLQTPQDMQKLVGYIATTIPEQTPVTTADPVQALELIVKPANAASRRKIRAATHYLVQDSTGLRLQPQPGNPIVNAAYQSTTPRPLTAETAEFGLLVVQGREEPVLDAMRLLQPDLVRLVIAPSGGQDFVYADTGKRPLLPINLLGEGMLRLFLISTNLARVGSGGLVLVDELENGLHYSALPAVWRVVVDLARQLDVQLIATTHSLEAIAALHRVTRHDAVDDVRLIRLDHDPKGGVSHVTYDRESLEAALITGLEVR